MVSSVILISELSNIQAKEIQTLLKSLGYYDSSIDGIVGKNTTQGWAAFKADRWLDQHHNIGPASYQQLKSEALGNPDIHWADFNSKVSQYFSVGEVALFKGDRLPSNKQHQDNIVRLAKELDKVRDWWGGPLTVTSWYRPPHVERAVGGSFYSHPLGLAADIKSAQGDIFEFQRRFEREWYQVGKWKGGFGRGANRGFIHLDLRQRRVWNY